MGIFTKEEEPGFGGLMPRKELRGWVKKSLAGILSAGILVGANFIAKNPAGKLISKISGKPIVTEKLRANEYQGRVDIATTNYFSLDTNNLEYVINDYNAEKLKDKGLIRVIGNPAPENKNLIIVDKIIEKGVKTPLYKRLLPADYSDTILSDALDYSKLTNIQYNKKAYWEQERFNKARITGRINLAEKYIEVMEDERIVGKVLVDSLTDYTEFRIKELGQDQEYTFYILRGETVDWKVRKKTKELFHADIIYAEPVQKPLEQETNTQSPVKK